MTNMISNKTLRQCAKVLRTTNPDQSLRMIDKSFLFGLIQGSIRNEEEETVQPKKRTVNRKRAAFLGHVTRDPKFHTGLPTSKSIVPMIYAGPIVKVDSSFISSYRYCEEANVLTINMSDRTYHYLHVTRKDIKNISNYKSFGTFYHAEIKGIKDVFQS